MPPVSENPPYLTVFFPYVYAKVNMNDTASQTKNHPCYIGMSIQNGHAAPRRAFTRNGSSQGLSDQIVNDVHTQATAAQISTGGIERFEDTVAGLFGHPPAILLSSSRPGTKRYSSR